MKVRILQKGPVLWAMA